MSLPYKKKLIPRAKQLRKNMTKQERHLWYDFLSKYPIRFQRQKTIAGFIVDFYCHSAKLVIELDGSQHYTEEGLAYDEKRTEILNTYSLEVVRFSNREIDTNFEGVCTLIDNKVQAKLQSHAEVKLSMPYQLSEKLIQSIQGIGHEYLIRKIVLFGSRARGEAGPASDIDLAVYPLPEFKEQGRFASCIDDLETLLKIDLVFINDNTDRELLENIRREGVVIYEQSSNKD